MKNLEKFNSIFAETFNVDASQLNEDFGIETVTNWDSVTQLSLVTAVEDEFNIMLDTDDILDFKSYSIAKEILKKYQIEL